MNLYPLLAEKMDREPELLDRALDTLAAWEREGYAPPARLAEWRRLLENARAGAEGQVELRRILLDESEAARRLKDFSPLAGLLSREERRKVFLECVYDH